MPRVPERFLGYAFCVGDLLLELEPDFTISSLDGAATGFFGETAKALAGQPFLSLIPVDAADRLRAAADMLTPARRLGPFRIAAHPGGLREPAVLFLSRLPSPSKRIYAVLSRPARLGMTLDRTPEALSDTERREQFYAGLEELFDTSGDEDLLVSVLAAMGTDGLSESEQSAIESYLRTFSLGGNQAAHLGEGRFALVHEDNGSAETIADRVGQATGVALDAASIDAGAAHLNEEDSVRALIFSLQQFAAGTGGMTLEDFRSGPDLITENARRVRAFRDILDDGNFTLVYQPVVAFSNGHTHHFEVLSRFASTEESMSPFQMICFAEEVGLVDAFDLAVTDRALEKYAQLRKSGGAGAPALAANLSGRSLANDAFCAALEDRLKAHRHLADGLSFEVTESARITDVPRLARAVDMIRAHGFRVYLDDFGAGAAGFQYLREIQVDALKIDGAYIRNALTSPRDRAFLKSMVTLCKELGVETVGEWVETREHAELLRDMGVTFGQGFYFGRPTEGLISSRRRMDQP
ncbi:EAL domain-containing protein [Yunchengibacter salinarum]|uniref:EAL domain-containing protein n=1 Tax=Yunchengibacter salinarum TaxID=3133399 RepID=UPI0035B58828